MVFSFAVLTVNFNTSCSEIYSEFYNTKHDKFNAIFTMFMKRTESIFIVNYITTIIREEKTESARRFS